MLEVAILFVFWEVVPMAKILVIDDEPGIRDLLDTLLRRKGYDVVLAESGEKVWIFFDENVQMSLCLI